MCLGKDMARFEAKIVLAMVLGAGLHIEVCPGQSAITVDESVLISNGPVCFLQEGLQVVVRETAAS